jgi:hypothetical protein
MVFADDFVRLQRLAVAISGRLSDRNVPPKPGEPSDEGTHPDDEAPAGAATDCLRDAVEAVTFH